MPSSYGTRRRPRFLLFSCVRSLARYDFTLNPLPPRLVSAVRAVPTTRTARDGVTGGSEALMQAVRGQEGFGALRHVRGRGLGAFCDADLSMESL